MHFGLGAFTLVASDQTVGGTVLELCPIPFSRSGSRHTALEHAASSLSQMAPCSACAGGTPAG